MSKVPSRYCDGIAASCAPFGSDTNASLGTSVFLRRV